MKCDHILRFLLLRLNSLQNYALRLRNMAMSAIDEKRITTTVVCEDSSICNGLSLMEHRRIKEIFEGSKGGTDSDDHDRENVGMVRELEKKTQRHQSSCRNEDVGKRARGR